MMLAVPAQRWMSSFTLANRIRAALRGATRQVWRVTDSRSWLIVDAAPQTFATLVDHVWAHELEPARFGDMFQQRFQLRTRLATPVALGAGIARAASRRRGCA